MKEKKTITDAIYLRLAGEGKTAADILRDYRIGRPALLKLGQELGVELLKDKGGGLPRGITSPAIKSGKKFSASAEAVAKALRNLELHKKENK